MINFHKERVGIFFLSVETFLLTMAKNEIFFLNVSKNRANMTA